MDLGLEKCFQASIADFSGINGAKLLHFTSFRQVNQFKFGDAGTKRNRFNSFSSSWRKQFLKREVISDENVVIFDRPFLYFARHISTGLILNVGHFCKPDFINFKWFVKPWSSLFCDCWFLSYDRKKNHLNTIL